MISTSKVLKAVSELSGAKGPAERWIVPLGDERPQGRNHFVLFLKPEVLAAREGVEVEQILNLVMAALKANGVNMGAVRVLNGHYLGRFNIMEEHYGVINRASRLGEKALSQTTRAKLLQTEPGTDRVLGGHEFLVKFPEVSAFALNIISDTIGTKKVASGKYYVVLNVSGERIVVLNPFHPEQVAHYTSPGRTVLVIECASDTDWATLRQKMTGATDPTKAEPGSIRRMLLDRKAKLGLADVGTATNGVHCSAGPLEAMLEFSRFFSDHQAKKPIKLADTPFGEVLAEHGLGKRDIAALAKNPLIGKPSDANYAFNITEEKNADVAAELLGKTPLAAAS
jgi:nucleoside diphosphate kinase